MPLLGAHMSIAGGYYKAVEAGARTGCRTIQLFTKSTNQWRAKELTDDDIARFKTAIEEANLQFPTGHDSYLINLASPHRVLHRRSIDSFVLELRRAEALGLAYLVTHPGSHVGSGEVAGLKRVAAALNEAHRRTPGFKVKVLLETTAGQGSSLGYRFEHLARILDSVRDPDRLGVCIDTCHIFAAGYRFDDAKSYRDTFRELDRTVGLKLVHALHLNDSQKPRGSRVDRHAHIGRGHLGLQAFRLILNDPRFRKLPMYLETPKGTENGEDLDVINLRTLRSLIEK